MLIFLALLTAAATAVILYLRNIRRYWENRGIPCDAADFPSGNMKDWRITKHLHEKLDPVYEHHKGSGPYAGFYFFLKPVALATDLDFIKSVLIKDFNYFINRGVFYNEIDDPLSAHLFAIEDEKWRSLRNRITPVFTSGKMKLMYPLVLKVADELVRVCGENIVERAGVVDVYDLVRRYTADSIGSCAFGLECNSLRDPAAEFVAIGQRAFSETWHHEIIDNYLVQGFPKLARMLRLRQIPADCHNFYTRIVRETVDFRKRNDIQRKDFIDLLLNIKKDKHGIEALTLNEISAQSFVFFVAGFETTASTLGFGLYELAKNPDIQDRLRSVINDTLLKYDLDLNYECLNEMKYLHQALAEILRMYPSAVNLFRKTKADYRLSDPKYNIAKGTDVFIPVYAIHHDPDIYPEPEKFNPDRFTEEEVLKRHACAYLPFGEGPRNCIGMRFAKMQAAAGLALLIRNYKFSISPQLEKPAINVANILLGADKDISLNVEKLLN